jgi:hypothetical protein
MPCFEARNVTVKFTAKNKDLFLEAVKSLGWEYTESKEVSGRFVLDTGWYSIVIDLNRETADTRDADLVNMLKRAYSVAAVEAVAKKRKWAILEIAQNKLRARRY